MGVAASCSMGGGVLLNMVTMFKLYLIILTDKYNKCSIDNNQWEPFESTQNNK